MGLNIVFKVRLINNRLRTEPGYKFIGLLRIPVRFSAMPGVLCEIINVKMFHLEEKRQFSICVSVWSVRYENGSRDLAAFEEDLMLIIPNNIAFKYPYLLCLR